MCACACVCMTSIVAPEIIYTTFVEFVDRCKNSKFAISVGQNNNVYKSFSLIDEHGWPGVPKSEAQLHV